MFRAAPDTEVSRLFPILSDGIRLVLMLLGVCSTKSVRLSFGLVRCAIWRSRKLLNATSSGGLHWVMV